MFIESSSHKHCISTNTVHAVEDSNFVIYRRRIIERPPLGSDVLCLCKDGDEMVSLVVTGGEQAA